MSKSNRIKLVFVSLVLIEAGLIYLTSILEYLSPHQCLVSIASVLLGAGLTFLFGT